MTANNKQKKTGRKTILILDNYDSFVYNLVQYVAILGAKPEVYRNDAITTDRVKSKVKPDGIIISPGPGNPSNARDFGVCAEILRTVSHEIPTFGICLGHQGIGYVYGAKISHAREIMHGKTSKIKHNGRDLFEGLPNPIEATRYHSLVIRKDELPVDLEVTANSLDDGEIMGIRHRRYPIFGVQFHPESIMTDGGMGMVRNFLDRV
jgi:anthranilate synthase/aminodeoxychorismate synthase-like glutamine amidotransferase